MGAVKIILLVCQLISCVVLSVIVLLQSSKESGLGVLAGNADNFLGRGQAATLDSKLQRVTKWVAAVFILLTLFVSLLYAAG